MQHISFDRLIQSRLVRKAFEVKEGRIVWDRSRIYGADLEMFDSTAGVIHEHASQNASPFLLVFTPQSSHAPFQLPPGMNVPLSDHAGLVRANAEWQYKLIDRLIAKLKETNQFSNTIFVVTGDHGIRSVYETNQLFENPQLLNEVSFRVPFWIFNAGRLDLKNPDWATSHIDVTPTILDLLGIPYAPTSYQGRTMLHPTERVVFFLGGEFLSPNGFKYGNRFYMENRRRKIVLVRSSFDFNTAPKTADAVSPDQLSTQGIEQTIATVQKFLHHK
jgi:phosphoglycerol transferase MdoB-like AlkP superfamily enzyme